MLLKRLNIISKNMKTALKRTSIAVLVALVASNSDQVCGGLLEGENGKFGYTPGAKMEEQSRRKCVWLVQSYGATEIQFTLDDFLPAGDDQVLILYPERTPGQTDLNPITLNVKSVGSTLSFLGSTVIVILPQPNSSLSFSWDSTTPENLGRNDSVTIGDYVEIREGKLTWTPGRRQERLLLMREIDAAAYKIYRSNMDWDGNGEGYIQGMAFDWIGGNVYVATYSGNIFGCSAGAARTFSCYTILEGQTYTRDISLNPIEGLMYWTRYEAGSMQRAEMDGSNLHKLVTGLNFGDKLPTFPSPEGSQLKDAHLFNKIQGFP